MYYKICILLMSIKAINIVIGQQNSNIKVSVHSFFFIDNDKWPELNSECVTSIGTSGQCKQAHNCPEDRFKLTLKDICFFDRKNPIVCCESNISVNPANPKIPNFTSNPSTLPASFINPSSSKIINAAPNTSNLPIPEKLVNPENSNNPKTPSLSTNSSENNNIKSEKLVEDPPSVQLNSVYRKIQLSNRIANRKCIEYQSPEGRNLLELNQYLVTRPPHGAFVSGNLVALTDNPQMAALGWKSFDGSIDWKCGGAIISENFIITAAHCAYDRELPADTIRVGDLNLLKDDNDTVSQQFNVTQIFVHPSYDRNLMYNDIALMKFSPNAIFTLYVRPACLWTEPDIPIYVKILTAMGYGTDAFAGKRTNELYEGRLAQVSLENCRQALGTNFQIPNGIIESQICAKDPAGKADTCQGDSGGPLVFRSGYTLSLIQHLVGITSFGESCAGSNPGVYTRVSSYIDWIESIVWQTQ